MHISDWEPGKGKLQFNASASAEDTSRVDIQNDSSSSWGHGQSSFTGKATSTSNSHHQLDQSYSAQFSDQSGNVGSGQGSMEATTYSWRSSRETDTSQSSTTALMSTSGTAGATSTADYRYSDHYSTTGELEELLHYVMKSRGSGTDSNGVSYESKWDGYTDSIKRNNDSSDELLTKEWQASNGQVLSNNYTQTTTNSGLYYDKYDSESSGYSKSWNSSGILTYVTGGQSYHFLTDDSASTTQIYSAAMVGLQLPSVGGGISMSRSAATPIGNNSSYVVVGVPTLTIEASSNPPIPPLTLIVSEMGSGGQTYWEEVGSWIASGVETAANWTIETAIWAADQVDAFNKAPGTYVWQNSAAILDGIQTALDVAGMFPGVGAIPDGINVVIHLGRFNFADAALSAVAMIPVAGDAIKGSALGAKTIAKGTNFAADSGIAFTKMGGKFDDAKDGLKCLKGDGCFVADTLVSVVDTAAPWSISSIPREGGYPPSGIGALTTERVAMKRVPIEQVALGARVATKNPRRDDYDFQLPEPEQSSWVRLSMEWQRTDGGITDAELLRPRSWVDARQLQPGSIFEVFSDELKVNGVAEIMEITDCPLLEVGAGEVVTGRFVTRQVDEIVQMTFATGDVLQGTASHPIWSPERQDWLRMGDWTVGDVVQGRDGPIVVTSVEFHQQAVPVYNLEIRGEHVYGVTAAEILVHNNGSYGVNPGKADAPKDLFSVGRHGDMPSPRGGNESHHGVMSRWMEENYPKYNRDSAPAVLMPLNNHNATRGVYNTWRAEMKKAMGGTFEWSKVKKADIMKLSNRMLNAAGVPADIQRQYYAKFTQYLKTL